MSKKIFFGQNDLRYYYYRYKDSRYYSPSIFIFVIIACVALAAQVILPQVNDYLSLRRQAEERRAAIRTINENIEFMSTLDINMLDNQIEILSDVLPPYKNFTGIINVISDASVVSGVSLSDFSFNVGEVATQSAVGSSQSPELIQDSNLPEEPSPVEGDNEETVIKTTVVVNGTIESVGLFLKELENRAPISEVEQIFTENNSATITINFYYKSFPEVLFKDSESLGPVSEEDAQLIQDLRSWRKASVSEDLPDQIEISTPLFE